MTGAAYVRTHEVQGNRGRLAVARSRIYISGMKHEHSLRLVLFAVVIALVTTGCRGAKINQTEHRVDVLEARVAALEAQMKMLAK